MNPEDSKKCLNSPEPVLNNRFIVIKPHMENIIDPKKLPLEPKFKMTQKIGKPGGNFRAVNITRNPKPPPDPQELEELERAKQIERDKAKKQFEDLKDLRQQADIILKQKMSLVQVYNIY